MTETPAEYRCATRAHYRAAAMDRIANRLAAGALTELPDIFLILIERALNQDVPGLAALARPLTRQGRRARPDRRGGALDPAPRRA